MLDKSHPQILLTDKYEIDPFKNPYMTKLAIKIVPTNFNVSKKSKTFKK